MLKVSLLVSIIIALSTSSDDSRGDPLYPPELFTNEQIRYGAFAFYILGIVYMFFSLQFVCDGYFMPVLEILTKKLKLRDDVAGATFLAVGCSAPELFTNFIGFFIVKSTNVGFGTIVGSGVFNVVLATGACALLAKGDVALSWWPLFRDII